MGKKLYVSPTEYVDVAATDSLAAMIATRERSIDFTALGMYLPNPDPVLKKMGKDIEVYTELRSDAHVSGCIASRKAGVKSLKWAIDRGKAKSRQAKVIEDAFSRLRLAKIISEILDAVLYGYQILEVVWERDGSYVLPKIVQGKPQRWFVFNDKNELRFRTKQDFINGEAVPERKFLIVQNEATYINPYGFPQLSCCFWPATFIKGGFKFWVTFTEKYGMPWPIAKHPRGAQTTEINQLLDMLDKMVQDGIAAIPEDSSVDLTMSATRASADLYSLLIDYCEKRISTAILGHQGAAQSTPGKLGNDNTALAVRDEIIMGDKQLVEDNMNQLIDWTYELNFAGGDRPRFSLYAEEDVDSALAERDSKLASTGQIQFQQQYIDRAYGFEKGDVIVVVPAPPASPFASAAPAFAEPGAAPAAIIAGQQQLDAAAGSLGARQLQGQADALLKPIIKLVNEGRGFTEIQKGLVQLFPKLDDSELQEMLARAVFLGKVWGRLNGGK
jgi:phage gp29-like protein